MAKGSRKRRGIASKKCSSTTCPFPSYSGKNCSKLLKHDWEDATCSVCMECPHNAVLLLCSSHEKGCRPYMCGTSFRYSNCLDQYKKACTKVASSDNSPYYDSLESVDMGPFSARPFLNCESMKLVCPLCRSQVKGWTVVEPARAHLNAMKRTCVQDNCLFVGTYKELQKHVRAEHPSCKPPEVSPSVELKWRRMEHEREREDVMCTIRSSNPGAVFYGDYVIGDHYGFDSDDVDGFDADAMEWNEGVDMMSLFLSPDAFGAADNPGPNRGTRHRAIYANHISDRDTIRLSHRSDMGHFDYSDQNGNSNFEDGGTEYFGTSLASRLRRQGRVILGRSERRRRQRTLSGDRR